MTVHALIFTAKPYPAPNGQFYDAFWGQIEFNEEETTETATIGTGERRVSVPFEGIASLALAERCPTSGLIWNAEPAEAAAAIA